MVFLSQHEMLMTWVFKIGFTHITIHYLKVLLELHEVSSNQPLLIKSMRFHIDNQGIADLVH
jgi:hypothetical protein